MSETNSNIPLELLRASDIQPKEIRWLWYPYIPFGKVTLLQGDPGDGKSNPAERYMVQVKSNLAPMGRAIVFEITDAGVRFRNEIALTAEEAFAAAAPQIGRPNDRETAAADFIRGLLINGRRLATDCEAQLEAAGFKKSTCKKAKKTLGIHSVKDGLVWYWSMP